jgi:hypothetical protein
MFATLAHALFFKPPMNHSVLVHHDKFIASAGRYANLVREASSVPEIIGKAEFNQKS